MSKQRQKGTTYETYLVPKLRFLFPNVQRAPARGTKDAGDFDGCDGFVVEAKKRNRWDLPLWIRQTNGKALARWAWMIVFAGDKRSDLDQDYVVLPLDGFRVLVNREYNRGFTEATDDLWGQGESQPRPQTWDAATDG